jgi:stress response protein YsnF
VDVEHTPPFEGDQGEVLSLPDGSLSVPVFEEQLVVPPTWVVRERVVLRKTTVTDQP